MEAREPHVGDLIARDRLEIEISAPDKYSWWPGGLHVNGEPFTDLVARHETVVLGRAERHRWMAVGGGLQQARERLLGTADDWPDRGQMLLLGCDECGYEACAPVTATIVFEEDAVAWRDIRTHGRRLPDLALTFDRAAYEGEIERALPLIRVKGVKPDNWVPGLLDLKPPPGALRRQWLAAVLPSEARRAILPVAAVLVAFGLLMLLSYVVSSH